MIEHEQPDLVSVTTWAGLHAEVTVFAAEHGARGIYVEKALCGSLAEADAMRAACQQHRVAFNYGPGRRYRPGYRKMREMGASGALGEVRGVIVNCGMGGLMHGQSHMVDTAMHLLGDPEPEFAQGYIHTETGPGGEQTGGLLRRGSQPLDAASSVSEGDPRLAAAYIRFTDGTDATIWANGGRWYQFTLVGTTGLAHASDNNSSYEARRIADARRSSARSQRPSQRSRTRAIRSLPFVSWSRPSQRTRPRQRPGTLSVLTAGPRFCLRWLNRTWKTAAVSGFP